MVLLTGPRQVGKTTVAREWQEAREGLYLNWDVPEDRVEIVTRSWTRSPASALVLDEIHKNRRWKNLLKGIYDTTRRRLQVVVTGSARLDVFQKGGDSLLGRYEYLRLHPFTIGELSHGELRRPPLDWLNPGSQPPKRGAWERLEARTGFPEPYFHASADYYRRWSARRRSNLIQQDLRELSEIRGLGLVEQLVMMLPERVGSPLSLNALREDLGVAHETVRSWLEALERLYVCFTLSPYATKVARSIRKERKAYLLDWGGIESSGARFENMVACHLLKSVHAWSDMGFGEYDLLYVRNKDQQEVDFLITERRKPKVLIECKTSDGTISKALLKFSAELGGVPCVQLVRDRIDARQSAGVLLASAEKYLANFT